MREITWGSRSYIIGIIANFALTCLIVVFATRLIGNPFVRFIVRYGAWIRITLRITRLTEQGIEVLDTASIKLGDSRMTLWLLVIGIFILSVFFVVARLISH